MNYKYDKEQASRNLEKYIRELHKEYPSLNLIKKDGKLNAKRIGSYFGTDERTIAKLLNRKAGTVRENLFEDLQKKTKITAEYWAGEISDPQTIEYRNILKEKEDERIQIEFAHRLPDLLRRGQEYSEMKQKRNDAFLKADCIDSFFEMIGFSYCDTSLFWDNPEEIDAPHQITPLRDDATAYFTESEFQDLLSGMSDLVEVALLKKRRASQAAADRGPDPEQAGPRS